jgi:hypothetical protein
MSNDDNGSDPKHRRAILIAGDEVKSSPPEIVVQSLRLVQAFLKIDSAEKRQAVIDLVELSARASSSEAG